MQGPMQGTEHIMRCKCSVQGKPYSEPGVRYDMCHLRSVTMGWSAPAQLATRGTLCHSALAAGLGRDMATRSMQIFDIKTNKVEES